MNLRERLLGWARPKRDFRRRFAVRAAGRVRPIEEVVPTAENYDVVIVGGGPGGYGAALYGAAAACGWRWSKRVRWAEPASTVDASQPKSCSKRRRCSAVAGAQEFGVLASAPTLDVTAMMARKQAVVDRLVGGLSGLLKKRKVDVYPGVGRLGAARTVTVTAPDGSTQQMTGTHVVLASGSVPRSIPGFEVDGKLILTSDEVFKLESLPAHRGRGRRCHRHRVRFDAQRRG